MDKEELQGFLEFANKEEEERYYNEIKNERYGEDSDHSDMSDSERKSRKKPRRKQQGKRMTKKQELLLHAISELPRLEEMFVTNDKDVAWSTCSEEQLLHHWINLHRQWYTSVFTPYMSFENAAFFMEQSSMSRPVKEFLNERRRLKLGKRPRSELTKEQLAEQEGEDDDYLEKAANKDNVKNSSSDEEDGGSRPAKKLRGTSTKTRSRSSSKRNTQVTKRQKEDSVPDDDEDNEEYSFSASLSLKQPSVEEQQPDFDFSEEESLPSSVVIPSRKRLKKKKVKESFEKKNESDEEIDLELS